MPVYRLTESSSATTTDHQASLIPIHDIKVRSQNRKGAAEHRVRAQSRGLVASKNRALTLGRRKPPEATSVGRVRQNPSLGEISHRPQGVLAKRPGYCGDW